MTTNDLDWTQFGGTTYISRRRNTATLPISAGGEATAKGQGPGSEGHLDFFFPDVINDNQKDYKSEISFQTKQKNLRKVSYVRALDYCTS